MSAPLIPLNDGRAIPQLGLGVWKMSPAEATAAVRCAVEAGYRHIDTASIYRNEEGVGEALQDAPEPVFLTTKLWNADQGYDEALAAFDASARRLKREVIDLYLIHWAAPRRDRYVESWKALIRLRDEGRARSIGVSNFTPGQLDRIVAETGVTPAVNQIELHPRFQQPSFRQANAKLGVVTQSWSPLGQGSLLDHPTIVRIAEKHGRTPAQAVLRWHVELGLVVIPKSVTPSRIRENLAVFDFRLDADDMAGIAAVDAGEAGRMGEHPERDH